MRSSLATVGWALLVLLPAPPVRGDEPIDPKEPSIKELADLSLEELMAVKVETATASGQTQLESPSTIFVITRETILARQYFDLQRLLEDIPEIQIDRNATVEWADAFTVRGIRGNQKFIVFLDGVKISFETGGLHSVSQSFSLANAERVEVVLGPSSAVYGADAFAGVVNIITRDGGDVDGASLTGSYGRFDTTWDSFVAGGREGAVALSVTGSYYHSGEPNLPEFYPDEFAWYRDRYLPFGEVLLPPDQIVTLPVETYTAPRDASFLHARLDVGDLQVAFARLYEAHSSSRPANPEFSPYVEDARWSWVIKSLSLKYDWESDKRDVRLLSIVFLNTYEVLPDSRYQNAFSDFREAFKYESNAVAHFEERGTWRPKDWLSFTGGLVLEDARAFPKTSDLDKPFDPDVAAASQGYFYPGSQITDSMGRDLSIPVDFFPVRFQTLGAYTEFFARPVDLVAVTAGQRVDWDSRYGVTLNPRLGLVLLPGEAGNTRIRLQYGKATLAPPPYLAYAHFVAFSPVTDAAGEVVGLESPFGALPNPDLRPEVLSTLEGSVVQKLGGYTLRVLGFYNQITDVHSQESLMNQTFKGWPVASVERWINRGQLETWGGTLGARAAFSPGDFKLYPWVAYSFVDGNLDDGPLLGVVKNSVKGGIDASYAGVSLSARVNWRGEAPHPVQVDANGDPLEIPGSWLVNLDARWANAWTPGGVAFTPFLSVENLLDRRNFHVSDGSEDFAGAPQDPLRILGGLTLDY